MRDVAIVCLRAYKGILGNYVSEGKWEQVIPKLYNSGVYSGLPQVRSVEEFPDFDIDFSGKSTEEIKESYNTLLNFKERVDKELGYSSSSGELIKDCSRVPQPDGCESCEFASESENFESSFAGVDNRRGHKVKVCGCHCAIHQRNFWAIW